MSLLYDGVTVIKNHFGIFLFVFTKLNHFGIFLFVFTKLNHFGIFLFVFIKLRMNNVLLIRKVTNHESILCSLFSDLLVL